MDMFVMEMLMVMIESLRLAHRDDKSLGTLFMHSTCTRDVIWMSYST